LEIALALIRKFPGTEKNCNSYRVSGLFGKFSFGLVRTVTVFAVGFWHGHDSLNSLILNMASKGSLGRGNGI
jgi:hypothetical protein